eukprot:SAG31_NODE_20123_length_583_cov_0.915289_1_plen_154_part_10
MTQINVARVVRCKFLILLNFDLNCGPWVQVKVRTSTHPTEQPREIPCLNRAGRVPSGHNKYSRMAWRGPCGWAHGGAAAAAEWLARWTMVWGAAAARGRPRTRRLARASPRGDTSADEALPNRPGPSLRRVCAPTSTGRQPVHHDLDGHASTLV